MPSIGLAVDKSVKHPTVRYSVEYSKQLTRSLYYGVHNDAMLAGRRGNAKGEDQKNYP